MKRLYLLVILLLFVGSVHAQTESGRIVFDAATHDFGMVEEGEQVRHAFTFRNEGDVPLRVEDLRPSCGCTAPTWTTEAVPPGGTGEIVAMFDSEGRPGQFRKSIRVFTDGEPQQALLYIEGDVRRHELEGVAQGDVVFDRTHAPSPTDTSVVLFRMQNTGERPVHIREAQVADAFVVEWPDAPIFSGDAVTIRVALAPGAPASAVDGTHAIHLVTDDESHPQKTLQLRARGAAEAP